MNDVGNDVTDFQIMKKVEDKLESEKKWNAERQKVKLVI